MVVWWAALSMISFSAVPPVSASLRQGGEVLEEKEVRGTPRTD